MEEIVIKDGGKMLGLSMRIFSPGPVLLLKRENGDFHITMGVSGYSV